jgi:hypothetical protein
MTEEEIVGAHVAGILSGLAKQIEEGSDIGPVRVVKGLAGFGITVRGHRLRVTVDCPVQAEAKAP